MADNNDSLIREVQQELDREKYERLWKQYGTYVVGAVAAVILSVAGYKYWESSQYAAVGAAGEQYETALDLVGAASPAAADVAKANAAFEALGKDGPGGYQVLGQLQRAGGYAAAGDKAAAVAAYDALAKRNDVDTILRQFAALQAATLRVGDGDWTEMENRLNGLVGPDSGWRYSALQLLGIAAFDAGKTDKAREAFGELIGDQQVAPSIRERASLFMARIIAQEMAAQGGDANADGGSGSMAVTPGAQTPAGDGAASGTTSGADSSATGTATGTESTPATATEP